MDGWVQAFIVIAAIAIVLQLVVLAAMALSIKKTTEQMTKMAAEVHTRTIPLLDAANAFVADARPKLEMVTTNLAETTVILKKNVERLDVTVNDIVDRTRLQVIRADELVTRTLDRVEETTETVHHTVISPVRQVSGVIQGITSALGVFLGGSRRAKKTVGVPQRSNQRWACSTRPR